jgi:hypothetical protein
MIRKAWVGFVGVMLLLALFVRLYTIELISPAEDAGNLLMNAGMESGKGNRPHE